MFILKIFFFVLNRIIGDGMKGELWEVNLF